jgi:hypothetical protein
MTGGLGGRRLAWRASASPIRWARDSAASRRACSRSISLPISVPAEVMVESSSGWAWRRRVEQNSTTATTRLLAMIGKAKQDWSP